LPPFALFVVSGIAAYATVIAGLLITRSGRECVLRIARAGLFGASLATGRLRPSRA